jgi:predicted metal-dependent HD superfamily phosphohydrolase
MNTREFYNSIFRKFQKKYILERYNENYRHYHNELHIKNLLKSSAKFSHKLEDIHSLYLMIWYHDVVYKPKNGDNEEMSAQYAASSMQLHLDQSIIDKIYSAIIFSKHKHKSNCFSPDIQIFLELDLEILGASQKIYEKYSENIQREYTEFIPKETYVQGRIKFINEMLGKLPIFYTEELQHKNFSAEKNLTQELKKLTS